MGKIGNDKASFQKIFDQAPNQLTIIIRCHHAIEGKIHEALEQALPDSNHLELKRVTFQIKVEFLIALGVLKSNVHSLFHEVNALRNRFAHNPYAEFDDKDRQKIKNILLSQTPELVPDNIGFEDIKEVVELLLWVAFLNISVGFERIVIGQAKNFAVNTLLRETIPHAFEPEYARKRTTLDDQYDELIRSFLAKHYPQVRLK